MRLDRGTAHSPSGIQTQRHLLDDPRTPRIASRQRRALCRAQIRSRAELARPLSRTIERRAHAALKFESAGPIGGARNFGSPETPRRLTGSNRTGRVK